MDTIFNRNIQALEKKDHALAEQVKGIDIDNIGNRIIVQELEDTNLILQVEYKERVWNLNSRVNPEKAAEVYAARYPKRSYQNYFVYGLADGRCVRKMLAQYDDTNRMVIGIPDVELFAVACHFFDIVDIISDKRVYLYVPQVREDLVEILQEVVDHENMNLMDFCILPAYDVIYSDKCKEYMDEVISKLLNLIVGKGTRLGFDRLIPRNLLYNMRNMIGQYNIEQIRQELSKYDLTKIPAIIVSAGPSLDKNIMELHKAKGKAFIIVVDAALRAVVRAGIQPDLVCTIDPRSPERFFSDMDLSEMIWVCNNLTNPKVIQNSGTKIFYQGDFSRYWNWVVSNELGYAFPKTPSGGCVSSDALGVAAYLGFNKIVLIGQDLAFTGGRSHTKGIEGALGDNDEYIQSRKLMQVEGINGEVLVTDFQMWYYKQWFERAFKNTTALTAIDATEGGAKIEGTIIQTLAETIERECHTELDIYQILRDIPPAFSEKQREKLIQELYDVKEKLKALEGKIMDSIKVQEVTLRKIRANRENVQLLRKGLSEMMKRNEEIQKEVLLDLVVHYSHKAEYELGDSIYADENMTEEQLIEHSINLFKGYHEGIGLLLEDFEEYIMKD